MRDVKDIGSFGIADTGANASAGSEEAICKIMKYALQMDPDAIIEKGGRLLTTVSMWTGHLEPNALHEYDDIA